MKRRKMSALQRKYFGKRRTVTRRVSRRKRVVHMARRRGGFRRYARRGGSRAGGGIKSMLPGILAGVSDSYLDPLLPVDGVGATGIGFFMHSPTIRDIGLYKVGMSLGNILPLPGRSGGTGGSML